MLAMSDDELRDLLRGYRPAGPGPQLRPRILVTRRADARRRFGLLVAAAMAASVAVVAYTLTAGTYREISEEQARGMPTVRSLQAMNKDIVDLAGDERAAAFVVEQAAAVAQLITDDNARFRAAPSR
jgi:hypothetical protein